MRRFGIRVLCVREETSVVADEGESGDEEAPPPFNVGATAPAAVAAVVAAAAAVAVVGSGGGMCGMRAADDADGVAPINGV